MAPEAPAEAPPEASGWATYGEAVPEGTALTAATLLTSPADYEGQQILVEAEITDVCQKAGCWSVIAHEGEKMRVLMKDHAFALPKDSAGHTARIHGVVEGKDVDPATVEHYRSEGADPSQIPEAGRTRTFQLVASGVAMPR